MLTVASCPPSQPPNQEDLVAALGKEIAELAQKASFGPMWRKSISLGVRTSVLSDKFPAAGYLNEPTQLFVDFSIGSQGLLADVETLVKNLAVGRPNKTDSLEQVIKERNYHLTHLDQLN